MKRLIFITIFLISAFFANAQKLHPIMLGFSPAITIEPTYPKGAFDINVFPIAIQYPGIIDNLDIRFLGLVNYGFRNYGSALINVGGEISLPYHFDFGSGHDYISKGFFIGPGAAFTRNIYYEHNNFSIFFEPGYNFLFNEKFSLIIDMQYGRTYFRYYDGARLTQNHFGVKVVLG
jgi:hypothetical protein